MYRNTSFHHVIVKLIYSKAEGPCLYQQNIIWDLRSSGMFRRVDL
jgi:hypothetical protein